MTLSIRHFNNYDPPAIVEIWRSCAHWLGPPRQVSLDVFDQMVFGKPHFDRSGLIMAFEDGRPIGFAHAGFGPNEASDDQSPDPGIICVVVIRPDCSQPNQAARMLLDRCESYLIERGAQTIYGGALRPIAPFYLGLYGGSEPPGILDSDIPSLEAFGRSGYSIVDHTQGYTLDLRAFRPVMNAKTVKIQRLVTLEIDHDAVPRNWWEACTLSDFDLTRVTARKTGTDSVVALATIRARDPGTYNMTEQLSGLMDIRVSPICRAQGVASYVLSEAFRQLSQNGVVRVDAQASDGDAPLNALFQSLNMQKTTRGVVFQKEV